jgi:hypothetical protein
LRCFILGVRFLFIFGEFINCDHNHVIKHPGGVWGVQVG